MKFRRRVRIYAALILTLLCASLLSCAETAADPLAYQERPAAITSTLAADTGTFVAVIDVSGTGAARHVTIAFTSPDTVAGIKVDIRGVESPSVTMSSGTLTLPVSSDAAERFLYIADMFRLDSSLISSADGDGGSVTLTLPHPRGGDVLVRFDGGAEVPTSISSADGKVSLSIAEYKFTADGAPVAPGTEDNEQ